MCHFGSKFQQFVGTAHTPPTVGRGHHTSPHWHLWHLNPWTFGVWWPLCCSPGAVTVHCDAAL